MAAGKLYLHELLQELEQRWRAATAPIDVVKELSMLTFQMIVFLLAGEKVAVHELRETADAFDVLLQHSWTFAVNPVAGALALFAPWRQKALATVKAFVLHLQSRVKARLEHDSVAVESEMQTEDLIMTHLLRAQLPQQRFASEVMFLFFAGYDTTANSTAFALHNVLTHPEWADRLQQETAQLGDDLFVNPVVESKISLALFKVVNVPPSFFSLT